MIEFGLDPSIDCVQWPPRAPHENGLPHLMHGPQKSICTQTHETITDANKHTADFTYRLIYTQVNN